MLGDLKAKKKKKAWIRSLAQGDAITKPTLRMTSVATSGITVQLSNLYQLMVPTRNLCLMSEGRAEPAISLQSGQSNRIPLELPEIWKLSISIP